MKRKRKVHGATIEESALAVSSHARRAVCLETGAVSLFAVEEVILGESQCERALGYFHHSCPDADHVMEHDR